MPKYSAPVAMKNFLFEGHSLTTLEAMTLFGVQSPWREIRDLKKMGHIVGKQKVPMIKVVTRLNKFAVYHPPANLPVREY